MEHQVLRSQIKEMLCLFGLSIGLFLVSGQVVTRLTYTELVKPCYANQEFRVLPSCCSSTNRSNQTVSMDAMLSQRTVSGEWSPIRKFQVSPITGAQPNGRRFQAGGFPPRFRRG